MPDSWARRIHLNFNESTFVLHKIMPASAMKACFLIAECSISAAKIRFSSERYKEFLRMREITEKRKEKRLFCCHYQNIYVLLQKQKTRGHHQHRIIWERALPGLRCKDNNKNGIYQRFFRKIILHDKIHYCSFPTILRTFPDSCLL